ncbi:MAG: hypothetical protein U0361_25025 [Nitrospiraceae bacterium]
MSKAFDFIREYRRWIGAILMCIAIAVFIPSFSSYRRMQRVLQAVGAQGAFAVAEFRGPDWLSETLDHIPPVKRLLQTRVRYIGYVEQRIGQCQPIDLSYLHDATTVEVLDLRFAPEIDDADLEFVGALSGLKHLDIRGPKVTNAGIRHLESQRQLESLYLTETLADDDCLSVLQGMPELEILFLDKIAAFTGTGLRFLPKASRLTRLDVCDTEFEQGLEQIDVSALERLIANRTPIGDAGIAPLHDACELQFLWLNDTQVTDNGLMYVVRLPKLNALMLRGTRVTDSGIRRLTGMNQLRLLGLNRTAVSRGECERLIQQLPRLSIAYGPDDEHPEWFHGARAKDSEDGPDSE